MKVLDLLINGAFYKCKVITSYKSIDECLGSIRDIRKMTYLSHSGMKGISGEIDIIKRTFKLTSMSRHLGSYFFIGKAELEDNKVVLNGIMKHRFVNRYLNLIIYISCIIVTIILLIKGWSFYDFFIANLFIVFFFMVLQGMSYLTLLIAGKWFAKEIKRKNIVNKNVK